MKHLKKLLIIALFLGPFVFVVCKLTVLNPAWVIGVKYPDAKRQLHSVNSPDLHFWSAVAGVFGVLMSDPDHSLTVTVDGSSSPIRLDDFIDADELYVKNASVSDISAYLKPSTRLSNVVFVECDFSSLPKEQQVLLLPYSDKIPNSFYVPYKAKR